MLSLLIVPKLKGRSHFGHLIDSVIHFSAHLEQNIQPQLFFTGSSATAQQYGHIYFRDEESSGTGIKLIVVPELSLSLESITKLFVTMSTIVSGDVSFYS